MYLFQGYLVRPGGARYLQCSRVPRHCSLSLEQSMSSRATAPRTKAARSPVAGAVGGAAAVRRSLALSPGGSALRAICRDALPTRHLQLRRRVSIVELRQGHAWQPGVDRVFDRAEVGFFRWRDEGKRVAG